MPTLKGFWYFKEHIQTLGENIPFQTSVNFATRSLRGSSLAMGEMSIDPDYGVLEYYDLQDEQHVEVYKNENWIIYDNDVPTYEGADFRDIWFPEPQEVSEEFYNWFTKNAVDLQPTGTWRFNNFFKLPNTTQTGITPVLSTQFNHGSCLSPCYPEYSAGFGALDLVYNSFDGNWWLEGTSYDEDDVMFLGGPDNWESEDARLLVFNETATLNPEFALWFYENAHSTELKLYSECYIAETADKIRECANDNTLTFKVSDLADGVQTAYDAGYSQGIADGGDSEVSLQAKTVSPSDSIQTVTPDSGYDGLSSVTVRPCTGTKSITSTGLVNVVNYQYAQVSDSDLVAGNIKSGVNILGVAGTYSGVELPSLTNPAATGDVLAGKEYIDASGAKQIGTIPSIPSAYLSCAKHSSNAGELYLAAFSKAPAYIPFSDYALGSTAVSLSTLEPSFKAENIKAGESLFGITGSYEGEGLTVNDMSIGTVGPFGTTGNLSLTVTDPSGNFAWKTYEPLVTQRLLPEKIIAGENILGVVGTGNSAFASVAAGVSLRHSTGSGEDEQVAIYYTTPEGTQGLKLVLVPASAYATPVSATFTTVINAPISVQVNDSTRRLHCYYADSEVMPLIGTDYGSTITYCVAKPGMANWPMIEVQLSDLEALGALCDWELTTDSGSYPILTVINKHPDYYLKVDVASSSGSDIMALPDVNSGSDEGVNIGTAQTLTVGPEDSASFYIKMSFSSMGAGQQLEDYESIYLRNMRWTANA